MKIQSATVWSVLALLSLTINANSVHAIAATKEQFVVQEAKDSEQSYNGTLYTGFIPRTLFSDLNETSKSNGEYRFWLFEPDTILHDDMLGVVLGDNQFLKDCIFDEKSNGFSNSDRLYEQMYGSSRVGRDPYNEEPSMTNRCWWTKATRVLFVEAMPGFIPINVYEGIGNQYSNFFPNFFSIFDSLREARLILVGGEGGFGFEFSGYGSKSLVYSAYSIVKENKNTEGPSPNIAGVGFPFESNGLLNMIKNLRWYGMIDVSVAKKLRNAFEDCAVVGPAERYENTAWIKKECVVENTLVVSASDEPHPFVTPSADDTAAFAEAITGTRGATLERPRTLSKNKEFDEAWNPRTSPYTMPTFVFLTWD